MSPGEVSRFDWVRDSAIGEAGCITLLAQAQPEAVVRAFGGDPAQAGQARLADALSHPDAPMALVRRVGDWVVVVENNGFEGSRPEVLRRLTGQVVSVFWNVNAMTRFSYAVNGTLVTAFEAMFPEHRSGAEPDALVAQAAGLPWEDESVDLVSIMLAMAARLTGFVLQPEHLDGPMMLVLLLPWPEDKPDQVSPRYEPLTYTDPALSYALQHAEDRYRWAAARAALRAAAAAVGLDDHPALRAAAEGSAGSADRTALDQMARDLNGAQRLPQFRVVEAARAALGSNALAAAFQAITEAGNGVQAAGADPAALRAAVMAALGSPPPPAGSGSLSTTVGDRPWDRYAWIDEHWLGWAAELTFVRGPSATTATGAGPSGQGPVRLERGPTRSLRAGDWILLLDIGEVPRPLLPHLSALSAGGEAVHVNWSARGQAHFWHVVDGDLRATFNVYQPQVVRGSAPSELDERRAGLRFPLTGQDGGRQAPMLLALAERITGIALTPQLLDADWTRSMPTGPPEPGRLEHTLSDDVPFVDEFGEPRLVALFDSWDPTRTDYVFYRDLAAIMPAQTIVDIGCGTGRLAVDLARQGHQVTGVDPSAAMLAVAQGRDDAHLVRWIHGDVTVLGDGEYDLAIMSGNVVQVITDNDALLATFAAIRRALRPGGRLAFNSRNPVSRIWTQWTPERSRRTLADGVEAWFEDTRSDGDLVTFRTHYRFTSGEELVAHNQRRFRSYGWLRRALIDTGFQVDPVDHDEPDLIFLATATTRHPVALQISTVGAGDLIAAVLYDTGETVTMPIGRLDTAVALQRLRDLDVPTDLALRELGQFGLGFDIRNDVRQRSETDMAAWRAADHLRREELKREFRQHRTKPDNTRPDPEP